MGCIRQMNVIAFHAMIDLTVGGYFKRIMTRICVSHGRWTQDDHDLVGGPHVPLLRRGEEMQPVNWGGY